MYLQLNIIFRPSTFVIQEYIEKFVLFTVFPLTLSSCDWPFLIIQLKFSGVIFYFGGVSGHSAYFNHDFGKKPYGLRFGR